MWDAQLSQLIVKACRILTQRGMVEGFGHVSARVDDGSFVITARKALMLVEPADLVRVDLSGKRMEGGSAPPVETPLHAAIYRNRRDVGAVCRAHSMSVSAFGIVGRAIRPVHGFGCHLGPEVPVFPRWDLISTEARGEEVVRMLGQGPGIILRGNGWAVVGADVREACVRAIFLDESARLQILAAGLGAPIFPAAAEVEGRRREDLPHEPIRAWEFYEAALMSGGPGAKS